jgi:ankyrin repeat protein
MQDLPCSEPQLAAGRQRPRSPANEDTPESIVGNLEVQPAISHHGTAPHPQALVGTTAMNFFCAQPAEADVSQRTGRDCALNSDRNFDDVKSYVQGYKEGDRCPEWVTRVWYVVLSSKASAATDCHDYSIKEHNFSRTLQLGSDDPGRHYDDAIETIGKVASILESQQRFAEAEQLYRRIISMRDLIFRSRCKTEKLDNLVPKFATMLTHIGDYDAAIEAYEDSVKYWSSRDYAIRSSEVESLLVLYHHYHEQLQIDGFNEDARRERRILPLHRALGLGCADLIQAILDSRTEFKSTIDVKDATGQTALHLVSKSEIEDTIGFAERLLEEGASLEARDNQGRTPLFVAAYYGMPAMVKLFLNKGADPTAEAELRSSEAGIKVHWREATPLHAAILRGHNTIALRMLARISNVNNVPAVEDALVCASIRGIYDVVALLLDKGLAVNSFSDIRFDLGGVPVEVNCALMGSLCGGHRYLSLFLLERGANVEGARSRSPAALWVAVETERGDLMELLLTNSANIDDFLYCMRSDEEDWYPKTPLQLACKNGWISGVRQLIGRGADPNWEAHSNKGRTALQAACEAGHGSIVRRLLQLGADENAPPAENDGRTALQAACEGGHESIVHILLHHSANVNAPPAAKGGKTALQAACRGGHQSLVTMLLGCGADINAPPAPEYGRTALQAACEEGHESIVHALLRHGANVNALPAVKGGRTALQAACEVGHESLVTLLLEHGADVNAPLSRSNGLSALAAAKEYYHVHRDAEPPTIVKILEDAGAIG